ncbi:MAG: cytochrome c-type biogenesis protein [Alphaproteobacteria bacterium]
MKRLVLMLIVALGVAAPPAGAVEPDEVLSDPALEIRAREISKELRCVVCQNQSIDDSSAPLARDLRILVRERLTAGDSDNAVIAFITERYGDFVLLRPPFKASTLVLWLGPAALFILGAGAVVMFFRRRRTAPAAIPLSADEQLRIDALLGADGPD